MLDAALKWHGVALYRVLTAFHFDDRPEALFELEQITLRKAGNRAGHQAEHGPAGALGAGEAGAVPGQLIRALGPRQANYYSMFER
jgi:hypothetical protein